MSTWDMGTESTHFWKQSTFRNYPLSVWCCTGWNDKIVFYHVWKWHNVQRARSEMCHCTTHALYRSKLWQQDHCQHPQNANLDGSMCPGWWKQSFWLRLWSLVWFQVRATSCHLISSKSAWKSTPVYLDVLKSVVIPWCNQVAGGRPWVWQQHSALAHKSKETQAWLQKECYDFVPFSHCTPDSPDLNPLDYFVWSYVENITNMTSHNTKASLIATIRRAPTGACGKGMLPVTDPYWGGDWGWRWLHWIDISSTT